MSISEFGMTRCVASMPKRCLPAAFAGSRFLEILLLGSLILSAGCSTDPEVLYKEAKAHAEAGELELALEKYRKIISSHPQHVAAHNNIGTILARQGDPEGAIKHFQAAIDADQESALAYKNLGLAYFQRGWHEEAGVALDAAIALRPGEGAIYLDRARLRAIEGRYTAALTDISSALERDPSLYFSVEAEEKFFPLHKRKVFMLLLVKYAPQEVVAQTIPSSEEPSTKEERPQKKQVTIGGLLRQLGL